MDTDALGVSLDGTPFTAAREAKVARRVIERLQTKTRDESLTLTLNRWAARLDNNRRRFFGTPGFSLQVRTCVLSLSNDETVEVILFNEVSEVIGAVYPWCQAVALLLSKDCLLDVESFGGFWLLRAPNFQDVDGDGTLDLVADAREGFGPGRTYFIDLREFYRVGEVGKYTEPWSEKLPKKQKKTRPPPIRLEDALPP